MEKEELLKEIEKLLSFDGNETSINPDYLEYFTLQELESIKKELERKQENMVKEHIGWMQRFRTDHEHHT